MNAISKVLMLGRNITLFPVIHGSGDFAVEVRRLMLTHKFSCLAVPLPPSFEHDVAVAVERLPVVSVVLQREPMTRFSGTRTDFESGRELDSDEDEQATASYVPIDPCQPVIAALRIARQERMARAFIDIETDCYIPRAAVLPDPYALKRVRPEQFAAAVLPVIPPPEDENNGLASIGWPVNSIDYRRDSNPYYASAISWTGHGCAMPSIVRSNDLMTRIGLKLPRKRLESHHARWLS
jgi:hypothetical protein